MKCLKIRRFLSIIERQDIKSYEVWPLLTKLLIDLYDIERVEVLSVYPEANLAKSIYSTCPHTRRLGKEIMLCKNGFLGCGSNLGAPLTVYGREGLVKLFHHNNDLIYSGYTSSTLVPIIYSKKM